MVTGYHNHTLAQSLRKSQVIEKAEDSTVQVATPKHHWRTQRQWQWRRSLWDRGDVSPNIYSQYLGVFVL